VRSAETITEVMPTSSPVKSSAARLKGAFLAHSTDAPRLEDDGLQLATFPTRSRIRAAEGHEIGAGGYSEEVSKMQAERLSPDAATRSHRR
jgi:hypothetical protein